MEGKEQIKNETKDKIAYYQPLGFKGLTLDTIRGLLSFPQEV